MTRVNDPLFGFEASGSIANQLTFRTTQQGVIVSRTNAPTDPKTLNQSKSRTRFRTMMEIWRMLIEEGRLPWQVFATHKNFTPINAFLGLNMSEIQQDLDFQNFLASPGAGGPIQPDAVMASKFPDPGTIIVSFSIPPLPEGWQISSVNTVAFPNQSPTEPFQGPLIITTKPGNELVMLIEGLPYNTECMVGAWVTYIKPNGKLAFSRSRPSLAPIVTAGLEDNYVIGPEDSVLYGLALFDNETGNLLRSSTRPFVEGQSFEPLLRFGGATTGITYVQKVGRYSIIADMCFYSGVMQLSSKGTATGNASFLSPVTSINESLAGFMSIPAYFNLSGVTAGGIQAFCQSNSNVISFVEPGPASFASVTDAKFTNDTWIFFAGLIRLPPI